MKSTTKPMRLLSDRRKLFWAVLIAILIIGAIPRILIYDFSLPYIDHPDEPSLYLLGQQWRGLFEFPDPDYHKGYPPIYPAINTAMQVIMEQVGDPVMGDVIGALRLLSVAFSIVAGLFVALIARAIAGDVAAWLAASFWALSPELLLQDPKALSDPLAFLVMTFALWLAVVAAAHREKRHFAVWSVLCGMVGIFIKYPIAPVLVAGGLVILWVFFKEDRKRGALYIAYSVAMAAVTLLLLVLNDGLGYSSNFITTKKRTTGFGNLLKPKYALENLECATSPLEPLTLAMIAGLFVLGIFAFLIARKQQRSQMRIGPLAVVAITAIVQPWAVTVFSIVSETHRVRDVIPATSAIIIAASAALIQIAITLPKRLATFGQTAAVIGVGVLVFLPQVDEIQEIVSQYTPADTRVELRSWSETTLDPGWVIVNYDNEKVFNNYWSGLPGAKWFNWLRTEGVDLVDTPLETWRDRDMTYAILVETDKQAILDTPGGPEYLDGLLLLRDFYQPDNHRGPRMSVYRLWRMEKETAVSFGDSVRLTGYDWSDTEFTGGDTLTFSLYWQADQPPQRDYSLFVHITPPDDREPVTQWDGPPAMSTRPTYTWHEVTETLIGAPISIAIPEDIPSGTYRVLLGIYDYTTGQRLPVQINQNENVVDVVGGDSLYLTSITIE